MKISAFDGAIAIIAFISIIVMGLVDVRSYKKGKYTPLLFGFRQESKSSIIDYIAYIGLIFSISFIENDLFKNLIIILWSLYTGIIIAILNIKSYKLTKDRRIIIQTPIFLGIVTAIVFLLVRQKG